MHDLENYNIEIGKDNRVRAYNKITHKVTSYPRILMENHLGRKLLETEDVHHKDNNPLNNDINNLEIINHKEHDRMHKLKYFDQNMICPECGNEFIWTAKRQLYANSNRNRGRSLSGPFCSKQCAGRNSQREQMRKNAPRT